jgi:hypothetical protein
MNAIGDHQCRFYVHNGLVEPIPKLLAFLEQVNGNSVAENANARLDLPRKETYFNKQNLASECLCGASELLVSDSQYFSGVS